MELQRRGWRVGQRHSAFTSGNPNAPQGSQVAFLQKTGTISQVVNFAAAGSYVISFSAAQRGNYGTSNETVEVLVDGTVVGTFTPTEHQLRHLHDRLVQRDGRQPHHHLRRRRSHRGRLHRFPRSSQHHDAPPTGFADPGFESPSVGDGLVGLEYRSGGLAVDLQRRRLACRATDSAFTSGNPNAPEGSQVAFAPGKRHGQPGGEFRGGRLLRDQLQRRPAGQLHHQRRDGRGAGGRHGGWYLHPGEHCLRHLS